MKLAAILPVALFVSLPGLRAQDISTPSHAQFAYVANSIIGLGTVSGYTVNPATGALAPLPVRLSLREKNRSRWP